VPFGANGEWYWSEPPYGDSIASRVEWCLWARQYWPIQGELDCLLAQLLAKPPIANGFDDPEASAAQRGRLEQLIREEQERKLTKGQV
jgi:hypothetical protein